MTNKITIKEIRQLLREQFGARKYRITANGDIHVNADSWVFYGNVHDHQAQERIINDFLPRKKERLNPDAENYEVKAWGHWTTSGTASKCYADMRELGFFNDNEDTSPSWDDYDSNQEFKGAFNNWFAGLDGEQLICRGVKVKIKITESKKWV